MSNETVFIHFFPTVFEIWCTLYCRASQDETSGISSARGHGFAQWRPRLWGRTKESCCCPGEPVSHLPTKQCLAGIELQSCFFIQNNWKTVLLFMYLVVRLPATSAIWSPSEINRKKPEWWNSNEWTQGPCILSRELSLLSQAVQWQERCHHFPFSCSGPGQTR